jgi:hypothetical protein
MDVKTFLSIPNIEFGNYQIQCWELKEMLIFCIASYEFFFPPYVSILNVESRGCCLSKVINGINNGIVDFIFASSIALFPTNLF